LRAFRSVKLNNPVDFTEKFAELAYFLPRDFFMCVGAQAQRSPDQAVAIRERVMSFTGKPPFSTLPIVRIWRNFLFVSQALPIDPAIVRTFEKADSVVEEQQGLLLRMLINDRAHFRALKTSVGQTSEWTRPALFFASSCLAESEYETWINNHKGLLRGPLNESFVKWLRKNRDLLGEKLAYDFRIKNHDERLQEAFNLSTIEEFIDLNQADPPKA